MDNLVAKINSKADNVIEHKQASKLKNSQDLKDVAEQFEALFVHQMVKQARNGKLAEGLFDSESQDTFNNMLDIEYSQILAKKNNDPSKWIFHRATPCISINPNKIKKMGTYSVKFPCALTFCKTSD